MTRGIFHPSPVAKLRLDTDDLAVRLVNTMAWRLRDSTEERMTSPVALLDWFSASGFIEPADLKAIGRAWKKRPDAAVEIYQTAIGLREAIYSILTARIHGKNPPNDALAFFNAVLSRPAPALCAQPHGKLVWRRRSIEEYGADLLTPIAFSAVELMTGVRSAKVRQCQDDRGCGWLFVDDSRAQNRRWCSMGDCGNRAKARRHYDRVRKRQQ
jgi:predicted RNA-binding Zn ribbon-like protein